MFGGDTKNLLFTSDQPSHADSSLALQKMQAGPPLTTTFFV